MLRLGKHRARPRLAAVGRLVDAGAPRRAAHVVRLAGADPHDVGVRRRDGDGADGSGADRVEDRRPRDAGVGRLPHAARRGGGVDHAADAAARRLGVVGDRDVGDAAAHDGRSDRPEDEGADEDRIGGERVVAARALAALAAPACRTPFGRFWAPAKEIAVAARATAAMREWFRCIGGWREGTTNSTGRSGTLLARKRRNVAVGYVRTLVGHQERGFHADLTDHADRLESDHHATRNERGFLMERPRDASINEAPGGRSIHSSRLVERLALDAHQIIRTIASHPRDTLVLDAYEALGPISNMGQQVLRSLRMTVDRPALFPGVVALGTTLAATQPVAATRLAISQNGHQRAK